jgi:acid stress-induced BolA-like protein IbaG/YrbA
MIEREVALRIESAISGAAVTASGDGSRMQIRVVSPAFVGLSRVGKQQLVYAAIAELISEGQLHAVTIQALTPDESR